MTAGAPIEVVNFLESPTGHLANLSAAGLRGVVGDGRAHLLPLFPAAGQALEGFARFINHSDTAGTATIYGIDDGGTTYRPITLALRKRGAAHFNSGDLESGNAGKGLSGGLGDGEGNWRLLVSSDLDVEALAYIRTSDGFVTTMHEVVRETAIGQHVPFFNPAGNRRQVSHLRLVNPTDNPVNVTVSGRDDAGESPSGSAVHLSLAPGEARSISAPELESGAASGLSGQLGDGAGKWQLFVSSDASIEVTSLLQSPTGHLANLSTSVGTIAVADPVVTPTGVESIEIDGETVEAAIDQVLVLLEEDVTRKELFDLRARAQELTIDSAFDPDLRMLQLVVDSGADEAEIIGELEERAGVLAATPNALVEFDAPTALDDEAGFRRYLDRSGSCPSAGPDVNPLAVPPPTTVDFPGHYWIGTIRATAAWEALSKETLHDNSIAVVDSGLPSTQDVLSEARVSRFDVTGNVLTDDDTPGHTHGQWVSASDQLRERLAGAPDDGAEPRCGTHRLHVLPLIREHLVRHHATRDSQSRHDRRDRVADAGRGSRNKARYRPFPGQHGDGHGRRPTACCRSERARYRVSHRPERELRGRHRLAAVAGKSHHRRPERP